LVLSHVGLARLRLKRGQRLHIATVILDQFVAAIAGGIVACCALTCSARSIVLALVQGFTIGQNDPIIMFGVLEIIFSQNRIA
jgi:hypothetical protein